MTEHTFPERQETAIRKFGKKARSLGWKYNHEESRIRDDGIVVLGMFDPQGYKHWIQVTTLGEISPVPTTMVFKGETK